MKGTEKESGKTAVLDLSGATCGSCVYTIEHVGRKISGISDVFVDVPTQKIYVEYNGDTTTLDSVVNLVRKLGYDASVRSEENG